MHFYIYVVSLRCRHVNVPPSLILLVIVPAPIHLVVLVMDMLGKALAPLHRLAEPELFLVGVGGVGALAADVDCLLRASFAAASSMPAFIPLALLPVCLPDHRCRRVTYGAG